MEKHIKVLIVDDSLFYREKVKLEISKDSSIQVVATAENAFDALNKILTLKPHVLVLDIEMPKLNGITFLKQLLLKFPIPVIAISSESSYVFEAMEAGAVDFVSKTRTVSEEPGLLFKELITKIKTASVAKVGLPDAPVEKTKTHARNDYSGKGRIIAIGASTGGTEAVLRIVKAFPADAKAAVLVVQHMPPVFTRIFAERLNESCVIHVKEAENFDVVSPGTVYIAPGDYHMKLVRDRGKLRIECFKGEKVSGHCPSVDVLFNSIAEIGYENATGVILTGMGKDGAQGLLNMRRNGNMTIGQDEKTSVVYGMPGAAYEMGAVQHRIPIYDISEMLI